jgi:hypothetical protein
MNVPGGSAGSLVLSAGFGGSTGGSSEWWARLVGMRAPTVRLPFAPGETLPGSVVSLAELARRDSLAVFFYSGVASKGAARGRRGGVGIEAGARVEGWRELRLSLKSWVIGFWGSVRSLLRRRCSSRLTGWCRRLRS